jgi:hypothetical protein
MLYYVLGVSNGGKVDIQQLSSSYEGSFARVRTESVAGNEENETAVTNDYILILASKSDVCLVHVHIPVLSKRCGSWMWKREMG